MALIKQKTKKGYPAEYWRILQYSANFNRNDAVVTLALYKDKATRDADPEAVIETISFDLGGGFHEVTATGTGKVKNIKLSEAYKYLKDLAIAESEKPEIDADGFTVSRNEDLVFFADAVDA